MTSTSRPAPFKVVIAGGGVAGLEAALALRDLAGERVAVTLVAPNPDFRYRPMSVREPFAYGAAHSYPLDQIARDLDVELIKDSFAWVDSTARVVHTEADKQLSYDALLLAMGARAHPRFQHAITIDDRRMDETLHGLIQDIEGQYVRSIAFVVPGRMAWPLPIYELALMTAGRAYDMNVELAVTIVTPEDGPLGVFGTGASAAVAQLLRDAGITMITSAYAELPEVGQVVINPGDRRLKVDRVVALPELFGASVRGLPLAKDGFLAVDQHSQVRGVEGVYAAGDLTDFPVKHGSIAAQQADAAAEAIAALAGAAIDPHPFHPYIHGILLTDSKPKYLSARITGGHGFSSELTDTPTWSPPVKLAAKYLAPYLEQRDQPPADAESATGRSANA